MSRFPFASNKVAVYAYSGFGLSLGIPKLPSLPAVNLSGDWNSFDAPAWMSVDDFAGQAGFEGPSLGLLTSVSKSSFSFGKFFSDYPGPPVVGLDQFSTGRTIGLPSITDRCAKSLTF